jgi:hypothetical protein
LAKWNFANSDNSHDPLWSIFAMPLLRFDGWEISLFEISKNPLIRVKILVFKALETTNPPIAGLGSNTGS